MQSNCECFVAITDYTIEQITWVTPNVTPIITYNVKPEMTVILDNWQYYSFSTRGEKILRKHVGFHYKYNGLVAPNVQTVSKVNVTLVVTIWAVVHLKDCMNTARCFYFIQSWSLLMSHCKLVRFDVYFYIFCITYMAQPHPYECSSWQR